MIRGAASIAIRAAIKCSRPDIASPWRTLRCASLQRRGRLLVLQAQAWSTSSHSNYQEPFRKQLKEDLKTKRAEKISGLGINDQELKEAKRRRQALDWQLTVGIEVHAQLNTDRKLFSGMQLS